MTFSIQNFYVKLFALEAYKIHSPKEANDVIGLSIEGHLEHIIGIHLMLSFFFTHNTSLQHDTWLEIVSSRITFYLFPEEGIPYCTSNYVPTT